MNVMCDVLDVFAPDGAPLLVPVGPNKAELQVGVGIRGGLVVCVLMHTCAMRVRASLRAYTCMRVAIGGSVRKRKGSGPCFIKLSNDFPIFRV